MLIVSSGLVWHRPDRRTFEFAFLIFINKSYYDLVWDTSTLKSLFHVSFRGAFCQEIYNGLLRVKSETEFTSALHALHALHTYTDIPNLLKISRENM